MKVVLLAPASVGHTRRWVEALHGRGLDVVLATQHDDPAWRPPSGVRVVRLRRSGALGYFLNVLQLKRLLRDEKAALLHAHYASGYGTTAALANFRPWLLSVWGSDVYDFPNESRLKGWLLRRNLRRADAIASTSEAMAAQVRRLLAPAAPAAIAITPFGIDTALFAPAPRPPGRFVVGTVKTLAPKYGVDTLLRAFAAFRQALLPARRGEVSLLIVGAGPDREALERLAAALQIDACVRFVGAVAHSDVPRWLDRFDVYVAASRLDSESFGVAVLEASASGLPVLVSDAGGLPEVVRHDETGLVLPRDDVDAFAAALRQLFDAPALRERLGSAGRRHVLARYEWGDCVDRMIACYRDVIARSGAATATATATATTMATTTTASLHGTGCDAPPARSEGTVGLVSVIVPCRNEVGHVEAFCASLWRQALPDGWRLQAIVADGMSDDGTAELLRQMATREPRLEVLDNPRRIVSAGLNLALGHARGVVVVRMDVHSEYAPDYVAQCLATLAATGADNVGGPWRAEADASGGPMQAAVAAAFQSAAVAGGALSRRLDYDGPADTVYLGAWPRQSFDRFGGFDETLVRNQDDEHNLRIGAVGGRIWQSSRIRSVYRPRADLGKVCRQYLQYGYWKPFVMKKHGQAARLRQLVPGAFVLTLVVLALCAPTRIGPAPLVALLLLYALAVGAMTVDVARGAAADRRPATLFRVPLVIAVYHVAYGCGSILGWCDLLVGGSGRERFSRLTR